MTREVAAVLVAAGESRRMGRDKLWIEILGRPVWRWSLDALLAVPGLRRVAVVVPPGAGDRFRTLLPREDDRCLLTDGGASRADSVLAGADALAAEGVADEALVLVHDAARPAASMGLIGRLIAASPVDGTPMGVAPAVPVRDSLARADGEGDDPGMLVEPLDRAGLVASQTPQLAALGVLRSSLRAARAAGRSFSDEAGALAAAGVPVRLVAGEARNVKLTDAGDLGLLEAVLRTHAVPALASGSTIPAGGRVGVGVDAHRLVPGRPLWLGGVEFPGEPRGLEGHSDGDAALHAVIDALLGASGAGDVGRLFPADDQWRGAAGVDLLRRAVARAETAGWRAASVDLAIVAARPTIGPRAAEMRATIAAAMGLDPAAVSVKGTTSDGLGFAGEEGIAAFATTVVVPCEPR